MILIGDVHGKTQDYHTLIKKAGSESTIQLGDFGYKKEHDWHLNTINNGRHKILFGNHDYYPYLGHSHSLGNFGLLDTGIFFFRGARSRDIHKRTEGIDWFSNEELTYREIDSCIDYWMDAMPEIVISHDCPQLVQDHVFKYEHPIKDITSQGMDILFEMHQPELWIFGHHHQSINVEIEGTKFVCLNELEMFIV